MHWIGQSSCRFVHVHATIFTNTVILPLGARVLISLISSSDLFGYICWHGDALANSAHSGPAHFVDLGEGKGNMCLDCFFLHFDP